MARFRDHFSDLAGAYATARPAYPPELFEWLAARVSRRRLAWDCATGNGQAAAGLAPHFERVVATDASLDQVSRAAPIRGVTYHLAEATASGLAPATADLVTIAQALHWFDMAPFVEEVRRVVRPGGLCAAWTYALFRVEDRIDPLVDEFANRTVGAFWPPQRRHVDSGYRTLDLGLEPVAAPDFVLGLGWSLEEVLAYVRTWSAVGRFRRARGFDPVADLEAALEPLWGPRETRREIRWRLHVLAGRV